MVFWRTQKPAPTLLPAVIAYARLVRARTAESFLPMTALPGSSNCRNRAPFTFTRSLARVTKRTADFRKSSASTLEAYARGRHLLAQEHVSDGKFEPVIEKLLARPEVDYIQVNSTTAGCFTFRIERDNRAEARKQESA
jgi:Protein of unknown function (DUF1203)